MSAMKIFLPLLLVLTACGQSEPQAPAASAPKEASAPQAEQAAASAASAAPASASASAASDAAASAPSTNLGGNLAEQGKAKWQSYTCDDKQKIDVRYYKSSAGPTAQVKFKGSSIDAPYSPELSDEDLSAFSNGEFTWTISNLVQTDFYQEADGFFVRHDRSGGEGEENVVDNLLVQNCAPVK